VRGEGRVRGKSGNAHPNGSNAVLNSIAVEPGRGGPFFGRLLRWQTLTFLVSAAGPLAVSAIRTFKAEVRVSLRRLLARIFPSSPLQERGISLTPRFSGVYVAI